MEIQTSCRLLPFKLFFLLICSSKKAKLTKSHFHSGLLHETEFQKHSEWLALARDAKSSIRVSLWDEKLQRSHIENNHFNGRKFSLHHFRLSLFLAALKMNRFWLIPSHIFRLPIYFLTSWTSCVLNSRVLITKKASRASFLFLSCLYKWTHSTLQAPEIHSVCQPLVSPAAPLAVCGHLSGGMWVFNAVCGMRRWTTLHLKNLPPAADVEMMEIQRRDCRFCFCRKLEITQVWSNYPTVP